MGWEGEGVLAPRGYAFKPRSAGTAYRWGDALESWPPGGVSDPRPSKPALNTAEIRVERSERPKPADLRIFFLWVCTYHECFTHFRERSLSYFLSVLFYPPGISLRVSDDMAQASPTTSDVSRGQQRRGPL